MPAAPPFFAHGRVLGAAQRDGLVVGRPADVAADAFADFIRPAFADFLGQERVGDGGAGGADEVLHALFDLLHHPVGRGEATDGHHGFGGEGFDKADVVFLIAFGREAGGFRVIAQGPGHVHIPQVRQFGEHGHHIAAFIVSADAVWPVEFIHRQPDRHGAGVAHGLTRVFQHFAQQARAVFQGAAVLVAARVGAAREELEGQVIVASIDIDDVKARLFRPFGRIALPAAKGADVGFVHGAGRGGQVIHRRLHLRADTRHARHAIGGVKAAVPQLDPGQ